jgi:hypothetical protein
MLLGWGASITRSAFMGNEFAAVCKSNFHEFLGPELAKYPTFQSLEFWLETPASLTLQALRTRSDVFDSALLTFVLLLSR